MQSFTYCAPTRIVFGPGTQEQVAQEITQAGGKRVLVLYGGQSAQRSGLLDEICARLQSAGLMYEKEGGICPNPRADAVQQIIWRYAGRQIDFVLAVGGGSVIDSAKCVALGLAAPEIPAWQYFLKTAVPQRTLPVGVVLTIAAAGSEGSNSAVLTEKDGGIKRGLTLEMMRPRFAILNPELCYTLPPYQIACGVTDMMMHTLDRYFNARLGNQLTDALGEALLRTVIANGLIAVENPMDYDAMSELMWCGSLSHNELTGLGGAHDFSVHQLGHVLSGLYDMAHGASLAVMWPAWARFVWRSNPQRFVDYARRVWGVTQEGESAVFAGIEKTERYFRSLGMPVTFSQCDFGVQSEQQLANMAYRCTYGRTRTIGNFQVLHEQEILEIYRLANH